MIVQFANYIPTHLEINEAGQTYGVKVGPEERPDSLHVSGRDRNKQIGGRRRTYPRLRIRRTHPSGGFTPPHASKRGQVFST